MAQWQNKSWVEILVDKGYDGAYIHYHAMANDLTPVVIPPTYMGAIILKFTKEEDLKAEMAKQHALTLMPIFNGN